MPIIANKTINRIVLFNRRGTFIQKQNSEKLADALCFVKESDDWNKIVVGSSEDRIKLPHKWKECYVLRFDAVQPINFASYFINEDGVDNVYQERVTLLRNELKFDHHKQVTVYWR